MALRVVRNRESDFLLLALEADTKEATDTYADKVREYENLAASIRVVMVEIGSGRREMGPFSDSELDEIMRIY